MLSVAKVGYDNAYGDLLDQAITGPVPPEGEVFRPTVADICRVMLRHYDDYIARI